ncbi:hypothetical protein ACQKWADRAFT_290307, partial [Trichoderma austrokoningii]
MSNESFATMLRLLSAVLLALVFVSSRNYSKLAQLLSLLETIIYLLSTTSCCLFFFFSQFSIFHPSFASSAVG